MIEHDPNDNPSQTVPQQGSTPSVPSPSTSPHSSGTLAMPIRPLLENDNPTATLAAPAGYDPAAAFAASTRASGIDYKPIVYESKEPLVGGRFEILRAHARGGMGQVSVARDLEIDREVALKEIQPRYTSDQATTARFVLEAQVTGKLEHPGIVPVYGRGQRPDGRPYYAMRFVSGQSLQEALDEFHAADKPDRDVRERSLALRQLLRRFVDVCNTIGYAHARGYLHRDIKPANVMLGAYGETLVVDWGLAKEMKAGGTQTSSASAPTKAPEPEADDFDQTREGFTHYGQAMGTPAFMSPEQAAGQWDVTGVGSDVYSLGAMLYAILTGAAPYAGPTREVLTRVQRGEFRPIKLVKSNVSAPLDAVCSKAMSFKIGERYPTALALAADVDRWLADEPVSCFREPFTVRAMRWAKRHRTAVAAASVLLLTGTVALAVGLFAVNREKEQTKKAYVVAAESRTEARDALLAVTDDAVGEILVSTSKPTEQQKKFLDNLIGMYERFAAKDDKSPETQLFVANAMIRVGRLQGRIPGRIEAATKAFQDAFTRLASAPPAAGTEWKSAAGMAHLYFGILKLQRGELEAETELKAAGDIYRELVAKYPSADFRFRLSQCDDRLGVFYLTQKLLPEAGERAEAAFAVREQLAKDFPNDLEYQFRLAQSLRQRGDVQFRTRKVDESIVSLKQAKSIQERLVSLNTTSAPYLALLADVESLLARYSALPPLTEIKYGTLPDQKPLTESVVYASDAVKSWGKLLTLYPGDPYYRRKLAEANLDLAEDSRDSGNARIAIGAIDVSKTILEELNRDLPNDPLTEELLGNVLLTRAAIFRARGNRLASEATLKATEYSEMKIKVYPRDPMWIVLAAKSRMEEEIVLRGEKLPDRAKLSLRAAWKHISAAAAFGNADALKYYSRVATESLAETKDDKKAYDEAKRISELPLPKGRAEFEAARFHGQYIECIKLQPDYQQETDFPRCVIHIGFAIQLLNRAIDKGYRDLDEMKSAIELASVREAFEFGALIDKLRIQ